MNARSRGGRVHPRLVCFRRAGPNVLQPDFFSLSERFAFSFPPVRVAAMLAGLDVEDAASSLNVNTEKQKGKYKNQKDNHELSQFNSKEEHPMPEGRDQDRC
jgi:hypothetical protein